MQVTTTAFSIDPAATCIFCTSQPTTVIDVRQDRRGDSMWRNMPCCFRCRTRYRRYNLWSYLIAWGTALLATFVWIRPLYVADHPDDSSPRARPEADRTSGRAARPALPRATRRRST
jgi:hypothetical protein